MVIEAKCDEAQGFSEGLAAVKIQGKYGYIDVRGRMAIKPQYNKAFGFSENYAVVINDNRWSYIDKSGKEVYSLKGHFEGMDPLQPFNEDLAAVWIDGKWGFIDKNCKLAIQPQFDFTSGFHYGLARVTVNSKAGIIDKNGKMIIQPQYDEAFPIRSDLIQVVTHRGNDPYNYTYIDLTGKIVWPQSDNK